jgi:hypothetical protein
MIHFCYWMKSEEMCIRIERNDLQKNWNRSLFSEILWVLATVYDSRDTVVWCPHCISKRLQENKKIPQNVSVAWNQTNRTVSNEVCRATRVSQSQLQFVSMKTLVSGTTDFLKICVSEKLPQKEDSHKQCTLFCFVLKREWSTCLRHYFSGSE